MAAWLQGSCANTGLAINREHTLFVGTAQAETVNEKVVLQAKRHLISSVLRATDVWSTWCVPIQAQHANRQQEAPGSTLHGYTVAQRN